MKKIWMLAALLASFGCQSGESQTKMGKYDLSNPDGTYWLGKELKEISGLVWTVGGIAAVQDEEGKIFRLALDGKAQSEVLLSFGKAGDYEGVTQVGDVFYVLKSDGDIFRVKPNGEIKKYPWKGKDGFDFEGLCYDGTGNRLLLACKEHPDKKKDGQVRIYDFDLSTKEHSDKPAISIDKSALGGKFRASGIAISSEGLIYLLSARTHRIMLLSMDGQVMGLFDLPKAQFAQAEGIAFDPQGNLYISNEGPEDLPGNVLMFRLKE